MRHSCLQSINLCKFQAFSSWICINIFWLHRHTLSDCGGIVAILGGKIKLSLSQIYTNFSHESLSLEESFLAMQSDACYAVAVRRAFWWISPKNSSSFLSLSPRNGKLHASHFHSQATIFLSIHFIFRRLRTWRGCWNMERDNKGMPK